MFILCMNSYLILSFYETISLLFTEWCCNFVILIVISGQIYNKELGICYWDKCSYQPLLSAVLLRISNYEVILIRSPQTLSVKKKKLVTLCL
jgi:hypothetical protein